MTDKWDAQTPYPYEEAVARVSYRYPSQVVCGGVTGDITVVAHVYLLDTGRSAQERHYLTCDECLENGPPRIPKLLVKIEEQSIEHGKWQFIRQWCANCFLQIYNHDMQGIRTHVRITKSEGMEEFVDRVLAKVNAA